MAVVYELLLARSAERWPAEMEELLSPAVAVRQGLVLVPLTTDPKRRLGGGAGRCRGSTS